MVVKFIRSSDGKVHHELCMQYVKMICPIYVLSRVVRFFITVSFDLMITKELTQYRQAFLKIFPLALDYKVPFAVLIREGFIGVYTPLYEIF